LKTGIIGARGAGKSTVFHALTGLAPIPGTAEGRNRARPGQIKVADPRTVVVTESSADGLKLLQSSDPFANTSYRFGISHRDRLQIHG
jgi:ATPase subunit of ABC transporter with duplicated ATPase domains